jgi:hypothetical protein
MSNELMILTDLKEMANAACKSGLFKMPSVEAALTLMMICQSEGIHPIQAMKRYHIIQGRPSMRSDAMLAEFQRQGGRVEWLTRNDNECTAIFSHEQGGSVTVDWTIGRAKAAMLTTDMWKKYPRQMLTARVISEGVRTVLPGVVAGIYTPEELEDSIDVTPEKVKTQKTPLKRAENTPTDKTPAEPKENATTPTVSPANDTPVKSPIEKAKALCDKIAAEREKPAEFEPTDAEIVAEPAPDLKAADRPGKATGEIIAEQKQIRKLAQAYGCKTATDFSELMELVIGRPVEAASALNDDERGKCIDWLSAAVQGG